MITTVDALKQIYLQVGGSLTDTYSDIANGIPVGAYTTNPDVCEAISKVASGGSGLPEVSSTDNGDILRVVGGEWAKADAELPAVTADDNGSLLGVSDGAWGVVSAPSPSGGGDIFWVHVAYSSDNTNHTVTYTASETCAECCEAVLEGKMLFVIQHNQFTADFSTDNVWAVDKIQMQKSGSTYSLKFSCSQIVTPNWSTASEGLFVANTNSAYPTLTYSTQS